MRCINNRRRVQAGDTIVEVLIAIAIITLVLTTAYATTNKNSQTMQAVQERTQAQKLVERQIELLRAADSLPSGSFCFVDDQTTATPNTDPQATDPCAFDSSVAVSSNTSGVLYHIAISPSGSNNYQVKATWDRLGGGSANVTMYYYEQKN